MEQESDLVGRKKDSTHQMYRSARRRYMSAKTRTSRIGRRVRRPRRPCSNECGSPRLTKRCGRVIVGVERDAEDQCGGVRCNTIFLDLNLRADSCKTAYTICKPSIRAATSAFPLFPIPTYFELSCSVESNAPSYLRIRRKKKK